MRRNRLRHSKNLRQIEGRNPVLELLRSEAQVVRVIFEEKIRQEDRLREIFHLIRERQLETKRLSRKALDKISKTAVHQGVIAWAEWPDEPSVAFILEKVKNENREPLFVLLPQVTYEQNLGAVLRTAEAVAADAVIVSKRAPELTPVVSRVAMGATEHIPLIHENIFSVIRLLRKEGIKLVAADLNSKHSLYDTNLTGPMALVIGDEHKGISGPVIDKVDIKVKIPMFGKINSLNLSVATGILLYEVIRQRNLA